MRVPRTGMVAALLGALFALTGCSAGTPTATPSAPESSSSGAYERSVAITLDVTIKAGKVSPSGDKVDVAKGTTVVFKVTSDIDDEVHIHTPGDGVEVPVKAGTTTTGQVVAADIGSFEVESHTLDKIIVILNVR